MTGGAGRIPRDARAENPPVLSFTFDRQPYTGVAGDTLASALIANGVRVVARSFKYHRPRGVMSAGPEEPCALVRVGEGARAVPNVPATMVELYDGLCAGSQNCWPSVEHDIGAVNNLASRLLPAGFYYKTFMWPARLWRAYEWVIRRAAGVGRAPSGPDPDRYERRFDHYDVAVVGAGPAGLAAALAAGRAGARVLLVDERDRPGGHLLGDTAKIGGDPALGWVAAVVAELRAMREVRVVGRATAFGLHDDNYLTVLERLSDHLGPTAPGGCARERVWHVRAREVVLAAGATERPLVFPDNDRPGVMLAGAVRAYLHRYRVLPGRRAVVFTNNDGAYAAALDAHAAGIEVRCIVDLRESAGGDWRARASAAGIEVCPASCIAAVYGSHGVRAVDVSSVAGRGRRAVFCDLVLASGGWNPTLHLYAHAGGRVRYDPALACFLPGETRHRVRVAGAAAGCFDLHACLRSGLEAGAAAAGNRARAPQTPAATPSPDARPAPVWRLHAGRRHAKRFVDIHNDVTDADIELAAREGYVSVEHAKRYTTAGMGPDQGKTGNVGALAILAQARGDPIAQLGTTTFRPPYTPLSLGAVAGGDVGPWYHPERRSPLLGWQRANGAVLEPAGVWRRPNFYPRAAESLHEAALRECRAVRDAVGICDTSTLGKIDIQGPDSLELLERVYTNRWRSLEVGRCRYGLMLDENGVIYDDGVTARLAPSHYLMSTTSGGAAKVYNWLEEWLQCEWVDLRVHLTSVTTEWASVAVAGPRARELLGRLEPDFDISPEAFPHMAVREGSIGGVEARVFRVSFTGELSYEVNVPAGYALDLWRTLLVAGRDLDVQPFGLEALLTLRAEKGFIVDGIDTDGETTPDDVGLGWLVSRTKGDFIGARSLARPHSAGAGRRQLVGLIPESPVHVLPEGGNVTDPAGPPGRIIGNVTSAHFGPVLHRWFGLAMVADGRARHGQVVNVSMGRESVAARIVSPVFHDPHAERMHA